MGKRTGNKQEILGVPATPEDIKKGYGRISRLYAILEEKFESGLQKRGLELLAIEKGEVVLETGFGTGCSLKEMASAVGDSGRVYGIDITPQMVQLTRQRLQRAQLLDRAELCEGDARGMPFEDDKFDAVYIASTLELFDTPDIPRVLHEIKRVLKPGGRLGVVSLSRQGREDSKFLKFYEWLHQRFPKYASCRPIYVEHSVEEAGYEIEKNGELLLGRLFPMRIVIARPKCE